MNYVLIKKEHENVKKQLLELQKRQAKHPEGKIIHSTKKKGINWFVSDGKTKEYTSDKAIIEALVRKKYELMLLEELQDEEKILERYEKLLEKKKSEEMLEPASIFQKYLTNSYQSKSEKIKSWIEKPKISDKTIKFKLDEDMYPYLLQLKEKFTTYEIKNILNMKSCYAPRLYEILKSYEFVHEVTYSIDELKKI